MDERDRITESWVRRAYPDQPARDAFRAELRGVFAGTDAGDEEFPENRSQAPDSSRTAGEAMLERTLKVMPIAPAPREGFRSELREQFLGAATEEAEPLAMVPRQRSEWRYVLGGLAAAALALVVLKPNGSDENSWRVHPVRDGGTVGVAETLMAGGEVAVGDERLEVLLPGEVRMMFEPGSVFAFRGMAESLPGSRDMRLELKGGRVFGLTGEEFPGSRLEVTTPLGRARIVGTSFAVELGAEDAYTCFCVDEGVVQVTERGQRSHRVHGVEPDSSLFLEADPSKTAQSVPFAPNPRPHAAQLVEFTAEGMPAY